MSKSNKNATDLLRDSVTARKKQVLNMQLRGQPENNHKEDNKNNNSNNNKNSPAKLNTPSPKKSKVSHNNIEDHQDPEDNSDIAQARYSCRLLDAPKSTKILRSIAARLQIPRASTASKETLCKDIAKKLNKTIDDIKNNEEQLPTELMDPVTLEPLIDPWVGSDGVSYNGSTLDNMFKTNKLKGAHGKNLLRGQRTPNHNLKTIVLEWLTSRGEAVDIEDRPQEEKFKSQHDFVSQEQPYAFHRDEYTEDDDEFDERDLPLELDDEEKNIAVPTLLKQLKKDTKAVEKTTKLVQKIVQKFLDKYQTKLQTMTSFEKQSTFIRDKVFQKVSKLSFTNQELVRLCNLVKLSIILGKPMTIGFSPDRSGTLLKLANLTGQVDYVYQFMISIGVVVLPTVEDARTLIQKLNLKNKPVLIQQSPASTYNRLTMLTNVDDFWDLSHPFVYRAIADRFDPDDATFRYRKITIRPEGNPRSHGYRPAKYGTEINEITSEAQIELSSANHYFEQQSNLLTKESLSHFVAYDNYDDNDDDDDSEVNPYNTNYNAVSDSGLHIEFFTNIGIDGKANTLPDREYDDEYFDEDEWLAAVATENLGYQTEGNEDGDEEDEDEKDEESESDDSISPSDASDSDSDGNRNNRRLSRVQPSSRVLHRNDIYSTGYLR